MATLHNESEVVIYMDKLIDYKLIGKRVKEKRLNKQLTQEQVAEYLNISNEYMSKIENAKIEINLKRLGQLSVLLETPIEYFIAGVTIEAPAYKASELIKLLEDLSPKEKDVIYNVIEQIKKLRK